MKSNTLINYLVQLYNVGTFPLNILIFIHYLQIYIIFRIFCNGTEITASGPASQITKISSRVSIITKQNRIQFICNFSSKRGKIVAFERLFEQLPYFFENQQRREQTESVLLAWGRVYHKKDINNKKAQKLSNQLTSSKINTCVSQFNYF